MLKAGHFCFYLGMIYPHNLHTFGFLPHTLFSHHGDVWEFGLVCSSVDIPREILLSVFSGPVPAGVVWAWLTHSRTVKVTWTFPRLIPVWSVRTFSISVTSRWIPVAIITPVSMVISCTFLSEVILKTFMESLCQCVDLSSHCLFDMCIIVFVSSL